MKYLTLPSTAAALLICGSASAESWQLTNDQLNRVVAGTDSEESVAAHAAGGMLVANASEAVVDETVSVDLDDGAQEDARGVNVVNAADSLIAQGVNVWDGQFAADDIEVSAQVEQSNLVVQSAATRSAAVVGYERAPNSVESSSLNTETHNLDTIDLVSDVHVDTSHQVLGQSVNVGLGVGVAGRVGIELGEAEIAVAVTAQSLFETHVAVNGLINLPKPFGSMQANGQLDNVIDINGSVTFDLTTPAVTVDAIGSVCYTKLGICDANADDNSIYRTDATHDETHDLDIEGALSVHAAEAEYIVIDESSLELTTDYGITLASGAQANLAAVNAVNAVGSMIANGVNVSRTVFDGGAELPLDLSQRNVVIQGL